MSKSPSRCTKQHKRRAARKKLPSLMDIHGGRCYWCEEVIVMRRLIPNEKIIHENKRNKDVYCFGENYEIVKIKIATVDHVVPLSKHGENKISNLVPACYRCNHNRGKINEEMFATF